MFQIQINNTDFISTLMKYEYNYFETFGTMIFNFRHYIKSTGKSQNLNKGVVTQVKSEENYGDVTSLFDTVTGDFDVNSKFIYKKSFKIKVKIKSVSKFTPKIILD